MTNGDLDAFIVQRWRLEHTPPSIRLQLLMLGHRFDDKRIMAAIRRYVDDASENAKINREKLWLLRLRRALKRFQ
jgi:hypothetical protein